MVAECQHHAVIIRDIHAHADELDDHEQRLRTLERGDRRVALAAGISSAIGAVLVAVITMIGMLMTRGGA